MASNQTQKELVRLLVMQHGLQRASELSGVDYDLVRQWESRRNRKEKRIVTNVTNPVSVVADKVESELEQDERETRLSLSRSARRMAKDAEEIKLRDADKALTVGKLAGIVHRWDAKQGAAANVMVNVAILGIDPDSVRAEADIIDQA